MQNLLVAGSNKNGQLSSGTKPKSYTAKLFNVMVDKVKTMTARESHSVVVKQDGSVWSTGDNSHGQLGDGTTIDKNVCEKVMSGEAMDVVAVYYHSIIL